jgi:thiol-disulfide isomerase/thioredoxin
MGEPISGEAASAAKSWKSHLGRWVLIAGALSLVLLFSWKAPDRRDPFARLYGDWRKISAEKRPKPEAFAERCLELARLHPDTPAELAALCWATGNAPASAPGKEAFAILEGGRIDRADPAVLMWALESTSTSRGGRPSPLIPLVLAIAKRNLDQPQTAKLLSWVCIGQRDDDSGQVPPTYAEAADLIADRFAASPDIHHFCESLGIGDGSPPWASRYEKHLRTILEKNRTRLVRCTASFALASVVDSIGADRQDEALALYKQFVKNFDGSDPYIKPVEDNLISCAKHEAEVIRALGAGKPAPTMEGVDLDGRPMTLADFRGKVVLVSFWATWCGPCMRLIPHERSLLERFKDKPFAIVGVNADREREALRRALEKTEITWRSFQNERPGKASIAEEWKVSGWPTLYLIDHEGIIGRRWNGVPGDKELDRDVNRLTDAATRAVSPQTGRPDT